MDIKEYKKHYHCEDWTVEQIARAFKGEDELGRKLLFPYSKEEKYGKRRIK